ncbi:MAG: sugar phosphate isomerase/epimerase [Aureliella sp.]
MSLFNRRHAVQLAAAGLSSIAIQRGLRASEHLGDCPICVFTKPFNSLSFDELAEQIAEIGFDGIEAPIRPGGHVEPSDVPSRLPKLVNALAKRDLKVNILTSSINNVDEEVARKALQTAAELGIKQFRMQYFKYDVSKPVFEQLDAWTKTVAKLGEFCAKLGIQAVYQNHAGVNYMGAALWDLKHVLRDIDPAHVGVAYDVRHATVEGGTSWPMTFRMLAPHVVAVCIKDFQWDGKKLKNVPLGTGRVEPSFFKLLAEANFTGPISLHEEYLNHKDPSLVGEHMRAIRGDYKTLRRWLSEV